MVERGELGQSCGAVRCGAEVDSKIEIRNSKIEEERHCLLGRRQDAMVEILRSRKKICGTFRMTIRLALPGDEHRRERLCHGVFGLGDRLCLRLDGDFHHRGHRGAPENAEKEYGKEPA